MRGSPSCPSLQSVGLTSSICQVQVYQVYQSLVVSNTVNKYINKYGDFLTKHSFLGYSHLWNPPLINKSTRVGMIPIDKKTGARRRGMAQMAESRFSHWAEIFLSSFFFLRVFCFMDQYNIYVHINIYIYIYYILYI